MSNLHRISMLLVVLFALNVFVIASPALAAGLSVTPQQGNYSTSYSFTGTGFSANESIAVSAHLLDASTVALPPATADGSGNVHFNVSPVSNWHDGMVMVTARGQTSGHSYSAGFHLVQASSLGTATISPNSGTYSTNINVQASGFSPNEQILVAVFMEDGTGVGLPGQAADNSGNINFNLTPDGNWHVGRDTIVASGASSGRKVTGPFQLSGNSSAISIPSWNGQYFNNTSLSGNPALTRTDAAVNFNWGSGSPDGSINVDNFSARWTTTATVSTPGNFAVQATADDGVRVWVDGQLVIDAWNDHPATTFNATVNLGTGSHTLQVEYYEHLDQALVTVTVTPQ